MHRSIVNFPSPAQGLALHLRLCDSDSIAPADLCRAYLGPLVAWLAARSGRVDQQICESAAHDALVTYVRNPRTYDPARGDLGAYLRMAARGDLFNLLQREAKHEKGRVAWMGVEDAGGAGNIPGEDDPTSRAEREEEAGRAKAFLAAIAEGFTRRERDVLNLMLAGEHKTSPFASALGVDSLSETEQRREVKKVKDRILKRIQRGGPPDG